jgi:hypothetical protein
LWQNRWHLSGGVQMSLYSELHLGVLRATLSQLSASTFWLDEKQPHLQVAVFCYYFCLLHITQHSQMIREVRLVAINKQHHREYYPLRNEKWMKNVSSMFIEYLRHHPSSVTLNSSPFSGNWLRNLLRNPFKGSFHVKWTKFSTFRSQNETFRMWDQDNEQFWWFFSKF